MDVWVGPFFFNDGTLSGATLANQFLWVTIGCETIGCEVLAVALDAGGCNARFVEEFFHELKKLTYESWMEEDDCCIVNPWDLKRKIFVWFCITHLMKAFRNQLYASQPGGSRGFQDKDDVPFGWGLVYDMI